MCRSLASVDNGSVSLEHEHRGRLCDTLARTASRLHSYRVTDAHTLYHGRTHTMLRMHACVHPRCEVRIGRISMDSENGVLLCEPRFGIRYLLLPCTTAFARLVAFIAQRSLSLSLSPTDQRHREIVRTVWMTDKLGIALITPISRY